MDAVIEAQEAERSRLAREVHDGPAQALSNAIFQVEHVERIVESDPALARAELRDLRDMLRRQLEEVRAVVSQLRPPLLDELGLNASILDAVEHMRTLTGLPIGTELDAEADALSGGPPRWSCAWCRRHCRMSTSTPRRRAPPWPRASRAQTGL